MTKTISVTGGVCSGDPLRAATIFHSPLKSGSGACDSNATTRSARKGMFHPLRAAYQFRVGLNREFVLAQPFSESLEQRMHVPEQHEPQRVEQHDPRHQAEVAGFSAHRAEQDREGKKHRTVAPQTLELRGR